MSTAPHTFAMKWAPAFVLAPLLALSGCSDLDFFSGSKRIRSTAPMKIEGLVLHHYEEDQETVRVFSDEARHYRGFGGPKNPARLELTNARVFFYERGTTAPQCQTGMLRATTATIYLTTATVHLSDDRSSPVVFGPQDIDFAGDVVYLDKGQLLRVQTTRMRHDSENNALRSDAMTTSTLLMSAGVFQEVNYAGFRLLLGTPPELESSGGEANSITGPAGLALRAALVEELTSVAWSCGPDDAPSEIALD